MVRLIHSVSVVQRQDSGEYIAFPMTAAHDIPCLGRTGTPQRLTDEVTRLNIPDLPPINYLRVTEQPLETLLICQWSRIRTFIEETALTVADIAESGTVRFAPTPGKFDAYPLTHSIQLFELPVRYYRDFCTIRTIPQSGANVIYDAATEPD